MPVTPLHLGPGTVFKTCGGTHLSITVFVFSQVAMDIEVIGRLAAGMDRLHGFSNTIAGATVPLFPTVLVGRPACRLLLDWWNRNLSPAQRKFMTVDPSISWKAAWLGGISGVYSHWLLDTLMHADARALWPFSSANPFVNWVSVGDVNALCFWSLVLGSAGLSMTLSRTRIRGHGTSGT